MKTKWTKQDPRMAFNNALVVSDDNSWRINAKADPVKRILKVYQVYGDVTNIQALRDALFRWTSAQGLIDYSVTLAI